MCAATYASHFCHLRTPALLALNITHQELDDGTKKALGGRDALCQWAAKEFPDDEGIVELASGKPATSEAFFDRTPGTASAPVSS